MESNAQERLKVGQVVQVEIGPVAHGGHFVARYNGQVIFVRHAITNEIANIKITSVSSKIAHADVVEVVQASPDRVQPPCEYAGSCGGCDFQGKSTCIFPPITPQSGTFWLTKSLKSLTQQGF